MAAVHDATLPGPGGPLALRHYRPAGSEPDAVLPALVYLHGGGWTIGDLDSHDVLCRELCNGSGAAVVSVDYRLGPEHPFPAAVEDAIAATRWVREHAAALRIDPARLGVGGDSAGGNLAAVVALAERDAGHRLAFQLLIYPATDQRRGQASHRSNAQGYLLTAESLDWYHRQYLGPDGRHDADWRASPLLASSHAGLPPAFVLTAGFDPLRDEGAEYAERLTTAGTPASHVCFERQIHGFITMGRVMHEARTAVRLCAAAMRQGLAEG